MQGFKAIMAMAVAGLAEGIPAGVYNEIGPAEIYYSQMVIYENKTADFSFLINSGCGRHKVAYPLLWEIRNIDFVQVDNETLAFMNKPEDAQRPEIVDINKVFASMGTFKLPIKVKVTPEHELISAVLKLSVNLKQQPWIDLPQVLRRIKGEPEPTAAAVVEAAACSGHASVAPSSVAPVEMAQSAASGLQPSFWLLAIVAAMPLASGMSDWLALA